MALYAWWITTERKVFLPATEYLPFGKHHHNLSHGIRLWTLLALVQVYTRHTVRHLATVLLLPPGKLKSRHIVSADSVHGSMELARRASLCNESFSLKSWACTSQNKLFTIETETSACRRRRLSPAHIVVEMFYAVNWHWYWKLLHDTRAFLLQRVDQFVVAGPTLYKVAVSALQRLQCCTWRLYPISSAKNFTVAITLNIICRLLHAAISLSLPTSNQNSNEAQSSVWKKSFFHLCLLSKRPSISDMCSAIIA